MRLFKKVVEVSDVVIEKLLLQRSGLENDEAVLHTWESLLENVAFVDVDKGLDQCS